MAICSSWPQGQKSCVTIQFPYTDVSADGQIKVFCVGLEMKILLGRFSPLFFLLDQYFISYYFVHLSETGAGDTL